MEYAGSEGQGLLKSQKHKPLLYLCCGVSDRQPLVLSQWAAPLPACGGRKAGSGSEELGHLLITQEALVSCGGRARCYCGVPTSQLLAFFSKGDFSLKSPVGDSPSLLAARPQRPG